MDAKVFSPSGKLIEDLSFTKNLHWAATTYLGMRLCQGYGVTIDNNNYLYPNLADFLAYMNRVGNIGDIYNFFLPVLSNINFQKVNSISIDKDTMQISITNN